MVRIKYRRLITSFSFFFFNDTATTEIYTLSLHDALPILGLHLEGGSLAHHGHEHHLRTIDRKSTRLNSSHGYISYAVFCLKKKKVMTHSTCWISNRLYEPSPRIHRQHLFSYLTTPPVTVS